MCAPPPPTQPHDVIILRHAPQHTIIGPGEKNTWGTETRKEPYFLNRIERNGSPYTIGFRNKKLLRLCPVVMHVENCCMSYSNFLNFWVIVNLNAGVLERCPKA